MSGNGAGLKPRVLNVGGNSRAIALPAPYADFEQVLLDIDPAGQPDIVCDARRLDTLEPAAFDAVYCSHNLEHYHRHEVPRVLAGFLHVLKDGGFAHVRVPDLGALMKLVVEKNLDPEDVLYKAPAGPVRVLDVIYGFGPEIERSGHDFFSHRTGFTRRSLARTLAAAGFPTVYTRLGRLEVAAVAFKGTPPAETLARFKLQAARPA
jgi:SAM-dependent methyltransferase